MLILAMVLISAALAAKPNIAVGYLDRHRRHNALARFFARIGHRERLQRFSFQGRVTRPLTLLWNFAVMFSITTGMAMAQLNTGTTTIYFSLYDPNTGSPHIHVSGWGIPGTQSAHGYSGALLASLSPGATTGAYLPISFVGETGEQTQTEIGFSFRYRNDTLDFLDTSPSWSNSGRAGTATMRLPTGSFHAATGFFRYILTCGQGCLMGSGTPVNGSFDGNIAGTGQINLPTAVAHTLLPSLYPTPPSFVQRVTNNVAAAMGLPTSPPTPGQIESHDDPRGDVAPTPFFSAIPTLQPNAVSYTATATCANLPTSCWLTTPSTSGTIPAFGTVAITANFSPRNLPEGVYPADLMLALIASPSAGEVVQHSPAVLILNNAPVLQLSETALQFVALAGSGPQSHAVQLASSNSQPLSWTAGASTLSGGNWLTVTPGSGASTAASVNIAANPAGLVTGSYFGRVEVAASGAASSPQSVVVQLTVVATSTEPALSTNGLVFVAAQNTTPAPQSLRISTLSTTPIPITAGHEEDDSISWFSIHYSAFTVEAGASVTLTVSVDNPGLAVGAYTGTVNVQNTADLSTYHVNVLLVVTPSGGQCTPTQLLPVITSLGQGFEVFAAVPVSFQTQVLDDCGSLLNAGAVQATYSSGDSSSVMMPLGNGLWAGSWQPHETAGGPVVVVVNAQSAGGLQGSASVTGNLNPNSTAPTVNPGGIVNAASLVSGIVAPGELISIFGTNLAPSNPTQASSLPLTTSLAGTQVLLGGQPLPLQFAGAGQINAVVPFATPLNGLQQLVIEQNNVYSLPETIVVAAASPAVFTQSQSGQGPGVIVIVGPSGTQIETSASQPASAGDVLVIYCAGLGEVSPPARDGEGAPSSPPSRTVAPVFVTIGGQPAQVQFAGLVPGYAGLYQINVVVPAGVASGMNVPVVITAAGFPSPPVTVGIR
jgi:uncharacterized protein (TIGR03437 family)